jgi:dTDP-4-dehydrorhamnose reductase
MSRFLVLGGSGYLGSRFLGLLSDSYGTFFSSTNNNKQNMYHFDGSNMNELNAILEKIKPDVVINCIGFTNVDHCDQLPEKCWKLNAFYPYKYAEICKRNDIKFVQISTDHFLNPGGLKLKEIDLCTPINYYGFSKLCAERLILEANATAIIVRTNFFHFNFQLPVTFLDNLLVNSGKMQKTFSFDDVVFTPISTNSLVRIIYNLCDQNFHGLINICGKEELSKYKFHEEVLKALGVSTDLHYSMSVDETGLTAPRPKYMALDCTLLESILNYRLSSIYDMIQDEILFARKKVGSVVK